MNFYKEYFNLISEKIADIDFELLDKAVALIKETNQKKRKIIIVGNGGSAAMASHVAVDLTKNAGIRAINFNEADLLTCFSNDYGYEEWVKQALKFYADEGDTVILISSSGTSRNILNGALEAKKMGLKLITVSGFNSDNPLKKIGDINLFIESKAYNIIEMTHHIWLLAITDRIIGKIEYSA
ncbi:MAG: SIS domain-containing protein [Bacteroidales bacterium]|nr:SIS domain-containing protein [Bacteroidales bacterium]